MKLRLPGRSSGLLSCRQVAKVLQEHLDHELDAATAVLVAEHLEVCRRCGLEAETYLAIKEAVARRAAEVPADSLERLRQFADRLVQGDEPED